MANITVPVDGNEYPGLIIMIKLGTTTFATDNLGNPTTTILPPTVTKSAPLGVQAMATGLWN